MTQLPVQVGMSERLTHRRLGRRNISPELPSQWGHLRFSNREKEESTQGPEKTLRMTRPFLGTLTRFAGKP